MQQLFLQHFEIFWSGQIIATEKLCLRIRLQIWLMKFFLICQIFCFWSRETSGMFQGYSDELGWLKGKVGIEDSDLSSSWFYRLWNLNLVLWVGIGDFNDELRSMSKTIFWSCYRFQRPDKFMTTKYRCMLILWLPQRLVNTCRKRIPCIPFSKFILNLHYYSATLDKLNVTFNVFDTAISTLLLRLFACGVEF